MSKQLTKADALKGSLQKMGDGFKAALPAHIPVEKFIRVAQTAILSNPAIIDSDRNTLFAACTEAAQMGLLPDNKEAALVPFKNKVTLIPMVQGLMKLVRNSDQIASVSTQLIHEGDHFEFWVDDKGEHLKHEPNIFGERGEAKGVYAIANLKNGSVTIEVMNKQQVMDVKSMAKGNNNAWTGKFEHEQWRKSVFKRLYKRLPTSTDIDLAIEKDNEIYDLNAKPEETPAPPAKDVTPNPPPPEKKAKKKAKSRTEKLMEEADEPKDVTPPPQEDVPYGEPPPLKQDDII